MKNKKINTLLIFTSTVPLVLLMWPFAWWGDTMSLILRVIGALSIQALFCEIFKNNIIKIIPLALTAAVALWGTYLFFTSQSWANATVFGLIADYFSPFICCVSVFALYKYKKR